MLGTMLPSPPLPPSRGVTVRTKLSAPLPAPTTFRLKATRAAIVNAVLMRAHAALRDAKVGCLELADDFTVFCVAQVTSEFELLKQAQYACKFNG